MAGEPMELAQFTVVDYIILALTLLISTGIGIYHGLKSNKTADEFLLANQSLSPLLVACSLLVTCLSSVSIMGYAAEAYGFGLMMYWIVPGMIFGQLISIHVIIPVFYDLQMKSINEYMVLRFKSPALKYMMLVITSLSQVLLLGIVLYAPSLALASVTPVSTGTYILVTGVVGTLYSSIGGMKAVVWTDFFQTIVLFLGLIMITVCSMWKAGGITTALNIARENGRLDIFNMSVGLYERHTTISTFILGVTTYGYLFSFNQKAVQRFMTQRSLRNAKGVMYANIVGMFVILTIVFLSGIGIYAVYYGCDPIALGFIKKRDQLTPFFAMHHLGSMQGVAGLFVACLFSATLSSISSVLNAVPTMLWNDFMAELHYFQTASEKTKLFFIKLLTTGIGLAMIGLAFFAAKAQSVIQAILTVASVVGGPVTGVFLLGIAAPVVGKKGAIAGLLTSIFVVAFIGIGAQVNGASTPMLPLHTHLCENSSVQVDTATPDTPWPTQAPEIYSTNRSHPLWYLFNISYTYYSLIGTIVCIVVGLVVTFVTGCEKLETVKPEHVMHSLKRKVGPSLPMMPDVRESVHVDELALEKVELK